MSDQEFTTSPTSKNFPHTLEKAHAQIYRQFNLVCLVFVFSKILFPIMSNVFYCLSGQ